MDNRWTFGGYWNTVFGAYGDAAKIVAEHGLEPGPREGFSEWVSNSEWEAWKAGGGDGAAMQDAWSEFHGRAVDALMEAAEAAQA